LLTIAAHGIGHALGLDIKNTALSQFAPNGLTFPMTAPIRSPAARLAAH
jgi:hypothetical protein